MYLTYNCCPGSIYLQSVATLGANENDLTAFGTEMKMITQRPWVVSFSHEMKMNP